MSSSRLPKKNPTPIEFNTAKRPYSKEQHTKLAFKIYCDAIKDDPSGVNDEDRARAACVQADKILRTTTN